MWDDVFFPGREISRRVFFFESNPHKENHVSIMNCFLLGKQGTKGKTSPQLGYYSWQFSIGTEEANPLP